MSQIDFKYMAGPFAVTLREVYECQLKATPAEVVEFMASRDKDSTAGLWLMLNDPEFWTLNAAGEPFEWSFSTVGTRNAVTVTRLPATPSTFPLPPREAEAGPARMTCSLSGVLLRASERMNRTRDCQHLAYPLAQLCTHLDELRQATSDADVVQRLAKFLRFWV